MRHRGWPAALSAGHTANAAVFEALVRRISKRVGRYLERQGWLVRDGGQSYLNIAQGEEQTAMDALRGHSMCYSPCVERGVHIQYAYVTTLCGGDAYLPGVEVLGRSLVASGTREPRLAMVTSDVSTEARARLRAQGWELVDVEPIESPSAETVQLYPRFAKTFTKLRAFGLANTSKIVLLDADTVVLRNIDDLFERPGFAAAPDFFST